MNQIPSRTLEEIVTKYIYEPSISSIFVEGSVDRIVLQLFINVFNLNVDVFEIGTIDLTELSDKGINLSSNRNNLIELSKIFASTISDGRKNLLCIIDKDFDILKDIDSITINDFLDRTDFSCIESYILSGDIIRKIININFKPFPLSTEKFIDEITFVLHYLFAIRYLKDTNEIYNPCKQLEIDSSCSINKQGEISFSLNEYAKKFCEKNNISTNKREMEVLIEDIISKFDLDFREYINGHDLMDLFFKYIRVVKNPKGLKEKSDLEKLLFSSLEISDLKKYNLFSSLLLRMPELRG